MPRKKGTDAPASKEGLEKEETIPREDSSKKED